MGMISSSMKTALAKEYQQRQQQRHELIAQANTALREAKQAIFSLHRGDVQAARKQLDAVNKAFAALQKKLAKADPQLSQQGAYLAALEEYVEAELFYQALVGKGIKKIANLEIGVDQYVGALSDMTGELTRQAVLRATAKDYAAVRQYAAVAEEVIGMLMEFDLVSHLRQKYDDAKRNLKRMESILYDISLRE